MHGRVTSFIGRSKISARGQMYRFSHREIRETEIGKCAKCRSKPCEAHARRHLIGGSSKCATLGFPHTPELPRALAMGNMGMKHCSLTGISVLDAFTGARLQTPGKSMSGTHVHCTCNYCCIPLDISIVLPTTKVHWIRFRIFQPVLKLLRLSGTSEEHDVDPNPGSVFSPCAHHRRP